ncbi:RNA-binding cell elongation regulator Jag/EloR [Bacillus taeanensis]|uniref:RNA-binding protein KhpB n=1 Tax=Bacillus taeanensis TaxID=273032 RepID=A0A366XU03_9BACI|nr:RNA-binding cell elongation regulator Jag/EloR [Bacillus taeanensis]RBW69146.1 protein jag [Bacillus taeanensis]
MRKVTVTGKSVEEAVVQALKQLNTVRDHVTINVMDEGKKGFLGFGERPAVVEVALIPDPVEEAASFLKAVAFEMGVSLSIERSRIDREVMFRLSSEKIALLIGKRGQTLNALQSLVNLVANRYADGYIRITLDAENYRERRKETLEQLAKRLSQKAIRTNRNVVLEPMPSFERKVIHAFLKGISGVQTRSQGEEPNRNIVIIPKPVRKK